MYIMMVSEQGLNVGRAVLWCHLVCGWCRGTWQLFVMLPAALFVWCVKTAKFNKIVIYTQRDGSNQIQITVYD